MQYIMTADICHVTNIIRGHLHACDDYIDYSMATHGNTHRESMMYRVSVCFPSPNDISSHATFPMQVQQWVYNT